MPAQAEYLPSELLCPSALCWVPAARCLEALSKESFVELSELPNALDGLGAEQVPHVSFSTDILTFNPCLVSTAYKA